MHLMMAVCVKPLGSLVHRHVTQDPNPEDPLNKEAAEMQKNNPRQFESNVQASIMRGHHINGHYFPPCK